MKKEIEIMLLSRGKRPLTRKDLKGFSREYRLLGRMLFFDLPENLKKRSNVEVYQELFGDDLRHDPWSGEEGQKLGTLVYGAVRMPYIQKLWNDLDDEIYQRNEYNKPFRSAVTTGHLDYKLTIFRLLAMSYSKGFSDMSMKEQAQLCGYTNDVVMGYFFGTVLQQGHTELQETLVNIVKGSDPLGKTAQQHLRGFLRSGNVTNWELVKELLLVGAEKDPVHQIVLKELERSPIMVLEYFIEAIIDHRLTERPSVVKTVDSWFGFDKGTSKRETVDAFLNHASEFLKHTDKRDAALWQDDDMAAYVALWVMAVNDVGLAHQNVLKMVSDATLSKSRKRLALSFASNTEVKMDGLVPYLEKNWGEDVELDYWILKNAAFVPLPDGLLLRIKETADALLQENREPVDTKVPIAASFYEYLIAAAAGEQFLLVANDLALIPPEQRSFMMKRLFPDFYSSTWAVPEGYRFLSQHNRHKGLHLDENKWQRSVLHRALADTEEDVVATALLALFHSDLNGEDTDVLARLLESNDAEIRLFALTIILKQDDGTLTGMLEKDLYSTIPARRLGALELLGILKQKERCLEFVDREANAYLKRKKIPVDEILLMDSVLDSTDDESAPYLELDEQELQKVMDLFTRRGNTLYQLAMLSLLKQSESNLGKALRFLMRSKNKDQRIAGLGLADQLVKQNKCAAVIKEEITRFRKRKTMTMNEKVVLTKFPK
ncbi:hypothetical protein [Maribacter sp. 2-571]|uniref:DUF5724 domain-containing protein n=1 Tax=Maribacter sp. 2-571 TaxID=3417569 RepID=UPI003D34EE42